MLEEMFEVNRTALTQTKFDVLVQIRGFTNLWILSVRYVAIDKNFPHHLNSFDNIPVNYTFGPLVNISVITSSITYFTNIINYTDLCNLNGLTYNKFLAPLTNNKILLFMTSLFHRGTADSPPIFNSLNLNILAEPLSM